MTSRELTAKMTTRKTSRTFLRYVEGHAGAIRARARAGPLDRLDPRELADQFGIVVARPGDLPGLSSEDRALLEAVDAKVWSGMGVPLPRGRLAVLLHPGQTDERAAVTIMEEVSHAYFGHRPSRLAPGPGGMVRREYDPHAEQEAYWTAAAALLPALAVARAIWHGRSFDDLAAQYGTSVELVSFRVKILGLWRSRPEAA